MSSALLGRTDLVTTADIEGRTELMLSSKAIAYLCGLTEDEVSDEFRRQQAISGKNSIRIPKLWRIKAQEIMARLGTDDFAEVLTRIVAEREPHSGGPVKP